MVSVSFLKQDKSDTLTSQTRKKNYWYSPQEASSFHGSSKFKKEEAGEGLSASEHTTLP